MKAGPNITKTQAVHAHTHTHTQAQPHTQTDRETDRHMHVGERGQLRVLRKVNRMKRNKTQRNKQFA